MFRSALSVILLSLLAGCGGGGSSTSPSNPSTPPTQTSGVPVTIQGPNTTQQYPVSSAAANFATDAGSTVTVSTDANGNISSFTISTVGSGVLPFSQMFTSFSAITQP